LFRQPYQKIETNDDLPGVAGAASTTLLHRIDTNISIDVLMRLSGKDLNAKIEKKTLPPGQRKIQLGEKNIILSSFLYN
jgi:hypothetical protein